MGKESLPVIISALITHTPGKPLPKKDTQPKPQQPTYDNFGTLPLLERASEYAASVVGQAQNPPPLPAPLQQRLDRIDGTVQQSENPPPLPALLQQRLDRIDGTVQQSENPPPLPAPLQQRLDRIDNVIQVAQGPQPPLPQALQDRLGRIDGVLAYAQQPTQLSDDLRNRLKNLDGWLESTQSPITPRMEEFGLQTFNAEDGSYSRPGDPTHYFWQPGGSIYSREGQSTFFNNKWDNTLNKPLPWTYAITGLKLQPTENPMVFTHPKQSGVLYYLQPDGTIFKKTRTGQDATYIGGTGWDLTKNTMHPLTEKMVQLQLTPNPDGSFTRAHDTGKYFVQKEASGELSLFYTGGTVSLPGHTPLTVGPMTYVKDATGNLNWDRTRTIPFDGRPLIHTMGLTKNPDGAYSRAGSPVKFYLQSDNSLFQIEHKPAVPGGPPVPHTITYRNGGWDPATSGKLPLDGRPMIDYLALTRKPDGSFEHPDTNCTGKYHLLRDGRLFFSGGKVQDGSGGHRDADPCVYENSTWTVVDPATITLPTTTPAPGTSPTSPSLSPTFPF